MGFCHPKSTLSSTSTAAPTSASSLISSSSSSSFAFGLPASSGSQPSSGFGTPAASSAAAASSTPAAAVSTVTMTTTTKGASPPVATRAPASSAPAFPTFGVSSSSLSATSASAAAPAVSAASFTGLASSTASSGTTSSFTGFSLSRASAPSSSSQAQSTSAASTFSLPSSTSAPTTVPTSTTAAAASTTIMAQTSSLVVASSTGTSSTVTAAVATTPKLPSEISGKTVEEIIKDWNAELQERTAKFRKQANAVAEWDKRILQNRDVLLRLEIEVAKVVETQASLERQLELIETHQQEVDKGLQSMEVEADKIYNDECSLLLDDEAASTRDAMYEQSELIERELEHMTEQIKSVIQTLNVNQGGELEAIDGMTPLDVVVRILNNQLSSLMWIDEKAEEFSSRIQKLASQG